MNITVLGTRGEIESSAPYHSKHSGVLIDDCLLFDCGEPEFLNYKPKAIFITHLHPDHAYFVRSGTKFPTISAPIYAPENYKKTLVHVLSKAVTIGSYRIYPIPTLHSVKVKSQAYCIEKGNERILYTGDMFWIEKKYQKKLEQFDLVITEASFIKEGGMIRRDKIHAQPYGHTGVPNLMHLFEPHTNHILFIHFGSWFYNSGAVNARKKLQQLAQKYDVTALLGYDGMMIDTKST